MLHDFLCKSQEGILALTEQKSMELAGIRPSSEQLKQGLPVFFRQLIEILQLENSVIEPSASVIDMAKAASEQNEPALAKASGHPGDVALAIAAGRHGAELLRLGYTLSHVVHAYGAMCQAITELAVTKDYIITAEEFHSLNRCLDVAIAGAVTEFQSIRDDQEFSREVKHLGFLAHELRNTLATVKISLRMIQSGAVGLGGNTSKVLDRGLKRFENLIDRSLAEVRLNVDPKVYIESINLLHLVNQIIITADIEAQQKAQILEVHILPTIFIEADKDLFYSALSNLVQNALKFTPVKGRIQIRASQIAQNIIIEVENECEGLLAGAEENLFEPFEQQNKDRSGLGLGLTISKRAVSLNKGELTVKNLLGRGCIFTIKMPLKFIP